MGRHASHPRIKALNYLRNLFGTRTDVEVPAVIALWLLEDLFNNYELNDDQRMYVLNSVLVYWNTCTYDGPIGSLFNITEVFLQVMEEASQELDMLLVVSSNSTKAADATDYMLDILCPSLHQESLMDEALSQQYFDMLPYEGDDAPDDIVERSDST